MARDTYPGAQDHGTASSDFGSMDFIVRRILGRTATAALVQVKAVRPADGGAVGVVDVQPMVGQLDGADNITPHGILCSLPYLRIQGGTNALIIDPVVGDIGIAWFASDDISRVKSTKVLGGPGSRRRFSMSDGLYGGGVLNGVPINFVAVNDAGVTMTAGASSIAVTAAGIAITGDMLTHNGVAIGATHEHTGVETGSGTSGPPV